MSDMKEIAITQPGVEATNPDPAEIWRKHRQVAVRAFLKSAVVIDNEPSNSKKSSPISTGMIVHIRTEDDGMTGPQTVSLEGCVETDSEVSAPTKSHDLDIRATSDAFAEAGMACAFVLPDNEDEDEDKIRERILNAAAFADILVIDWFLRGESSSNFTRDVLTAIAKKDAAENGRMRLICIYTGQETDKNILDDAKEALKGGGIVVKNQGRDAACAMGPHCMLMVLSKIDVPPESLPNELISAFMQLADGLLPSFALAAVAAIRKNAHHMITRFSADLDAAYVANRLIADPPGDVAELMRELFVAECDNAIGLDGVADEFLEIEQIRKWFDVTKQPRGAVKYGQNNPGGEFQLDRDFLNCLLQYGVSDSNMILDENGATRPFPETQRKLVAQALHKKLADSASTEEEFARLVALKREAFGSKGLRSHNSHWRPSLTIGTLLKKKGDPLMGSQYFMCLSPACDTLRLKGKERRFVFLGNTVEKDKCNLVVVNDEKSIQHLYFDSQQPHMFTFYFKGDSQTGRVQANPHSDENGTTPPVFEFVASKHETYHFVWLAEVRYSRATSDMADVMRNWMRIGINDSEFLRLAAKGSAKFK